MVVVGFVVIDVVLVVVVIVMVVVVLLVVEFVVVVVVVVVVVAHLVLAYRMERPSTAFWPVRVSSERYFSLWCSDDFFMFVSEVILELLGYKGSQGSSRGILLGYLQSPRLA